jgi:hypothetical protein
MSEPRKRHTDGCAQSGASKSERGRSTATGASPEETRAVMFRTDGLGWGTSESVHAKSTDNTGNRLKIGRKVGLECGAFDGTNRQSG